MDIRDRITRNFNQIRERIADAAGRAGRDPDSVLMIPVTKSVGLEETRVLIDLGVTDLGENRIEVAREKMDAFGNAVRWHMIGNVQRRKARDIIAAFDTVDAVDRLKLASTLQQRCEELDRHLDVLVEVNVSGEEVKHGLEPESVPEALEAMVGLDRLQVQGLMTMAPFGAEEAVLRRIFGGLRDLAAQHKLPEISMGMTDDFEIAVEEGATQVRIGRALFS